MSGSDTKWCQKHPVSCRSVGGKGSMMRRGKGMVRLSRADRRATLNQISTLYNCGEQKTDFRIPKLQMDGLQHYKAASGSTPVCEENESDPYSGHTICGPVLFFLVSNCTHSQCTRETIISLPIWCTYIRSKKIKIRVQIPTRALGENRPLPRTTVDSYTIFYVWIYF